MPSTRRSGATFIPTLRERDDSYPSTANRRKAINEDVVVKESWILEGQDREAGFIFAVRRLYKTIAFPEVEMVEVDFKSGDPKVIGEFKVLPKQLIGLPDYGARTHFRDPNTFELITASAVEQPEKRRIRTKQIMFNKPLKAFDAKGPRQLCEALYDAICGLLNAFRMGYVHREITPGNVCIIPDLGSQPGCMLSKDGKSVEGPARHFSGFIWDFTVCKNINGEDDQYTGDDEIFELAPSTPFTLLAAEKRSEIPHSPVYDLDSFHWLLLYVASEIICEHVAGRRKVKLDDPMFLSAKAKKEKNKIPDRQFWDPSAVDPSSSGSSAKEICQNCASALQDDTADDTSAAASQGMTGEETVTINSEGSIPAQNGAQVLSVVDVSMDVDIDKAEAKHEKCDDGDVNMNEADVEPHVAHEEERKRKRDDEADSEEPGKAKGKQKATAETDEEKPSSDEESPDIELPPDVWYFYPLGKSYMINVMKPFEFQPPKNFEPPQKPQYVAFADDKMAYVINTLLEPRDMFKWTNKPIRGHLRKKLDDFMADSPGLAPFIPLVKALSMLGTYYYTREADLSTRTFSKDEVEEAFERYLVAFKGHMPEEDNWYYLKYYEGSDMLCKFERDECLGAFASPSNYKPS